MTFKERIESAKPYAGGIVIGVIATLIVGLSAGWLVTSSTLAEEVRLAKVNTYAEICASDAITDWQQDGNKLAQLEGWDNREAREKQVGQFLPKTTADLKDDIQDACEDRIEQAV